MKYYKFNEPYFALISSYSSDLAKIIYMRDVCDAEEGFEMEEISQTEAFELIDDAAVDEESDREELKKSSWTASY